MNIANMTSTEADLYRRICNFKLDQAEAAFPFSQRLAWEYQWTGIYTYRAIQEYKKFVFLATVTDHILSPSTVVDRVWHLHLLYTHSYWDDFCGKVLNKALHHSLGLGGKQDGLKYRYYYVQTLEMYQKYFGTPPADIWNAPKMKSETISYQWVDRQQYWILPKFNVLLKWMGNNWKLIKTKLHV